MLVYTYVVHKSNVYKFGRSFRHEKFMYSAKTVKKYLLFIFIYDAHVKTLNLNIKIPSN